MSHSEDKQFQGEFAEFVKYTLLWREGEECVIWAILNSLEAQATCSCPTFICIRLSERSFTSLGINCSCHREYISTVLPNVSHHTEEDPSDFLAVCLENRVLL